MAGVWLRRAASTAAEDVPQGNMAAVSRHEPHYRLNAKASGDLLEVHEQAPGRGAQTDRSLALPKACSFRLDHLNRHDDPSL